jgi:inward rectifier potassium channel
MRPDNSSDPAEGVELDVATTPRNLEDGLAHNDRHLSLSRSASPSLSHYLDTTPRSTVKRSATLKMGSHEPKTEEDIDAFPEVEDYPFDSFEVSDAVAWVMGKSLLSILGISLVLFALSVFFFGLLFAVDLDGIHTPTGERADLMECTWLSVHTFTTIGYGALYPKSTYTHLVATANSFAGILYTAVLTSVFMAHLMTPKAHWKLSDVLVIHRDEDGRIVLEGRMVFAPDRIYLDMQAHMQVTAFIRHSIGSPQGNSIKGTITKDCKLDTPTVLIRDRMWSIMHVIDQDSPLYSHVPANLSNLQDVCDITVKVEGKDPRLQSLATSAKIYNSYDGILMKEEFQELVVSRPAKKSGPNGPTTAKFIVAKNLSETKKCQ